MASHGKRLTKIPPQATPKTVAVKKPRGSVEDRDAVVIRFSGDAADGMQLVATQFTAASTQYGSGVFTLPDPPAEIRAPAGTLAGVANFQVHVSKSAVQTPGDTLDALVAMNPAALKANLADLSAGGILIVNTDTFNADELSKAGYVSNPLVDGSLSNYRVIAVALDQLNRSAVAQVSLSGPETGRCRNFCILGLACWLFSRPLEPTSRWIRDTYAKNPAMIEAANRALAAGYQYPGTFATSSVQYRIPKATLPAGRYRKITGNEAIALGLLTAVHQTKRPMVFASFPLAPANELLHKLCEKKQPDVHVIQAEDDIAAINLALGASFAGAIGVTATTSPGLSLQSETLGLAVMSELPCVVIDVQRAGPSAGMPSKSEQADLALAMNGRHGECPLVVLAMATPADGFDIIREAIRLATRHMTPVIVLADGFVTTGAEVWPVPTLAELPPIKIEFAGRTDRPFLPYQRDGNFVRPWAIPGTPGLEHRVGGLEKEAGTGNVSFDPINHEAMAQARAQKIARVADDIPLLDVVGPSRGELLLLGWGSTHGAIAAAVERCQRRGMSVARAHLRHLNPLPKNLADVLQRYRRVLIPELNSGQLCKLLRAEFLVDAISLSKVQGRPFLVSELERKIGEVVRADAG